MRDIRAIACTRSRASAAPPSRATEGSIFRHLVGSASRAGYNANHVHPIGWISSALYIVLPDLVEDELATAGWLTLGEAPIELGFDPPPAQRIEPKPGRLALFPSWMWHGTRPFTAASG